MARKWDTEAYQERMAGQVERINRITTCTRCNAVLDEFDNLCPYCNAVQIADFQEPYYSPETEERDFLQELEPLNM